MQTIDQFAAKQLGAESHAALDAVAAKHGLTVTFKGGSYDPSTGRYAPRFEFAVADADRNAFEGGARLLGLDPADFGRRFSTGLQSFTITGLNLRAPKYPVLAEGDDGKTYKFPEATVKAGLARQSES